MVRFCAALPGAACLAQMRGVRALFPRSSQPSFPNFQTFHNSRNHFKPRFCVKSSPNFFKSRALRKELPNSNSAVAQTRNANAADENWRVARRSPRLPPPPSARATATSGAILDNRIHIKCEPCFNHLPIILGTSKSKPRPFKIKHILKANSKSSGERCEKEKKRAPPPPSRFPGWGYYKKYPGDFCMCLKVTFS